MSIDRKRTHTQRSSSPSPLPPPKRGSVFPSHQTTPNLPPKVQIICDILSTTPSPSIEALLTDTGLRVTQCDVENVLKFSYPFLHQALKFFRWSGEQLQDQHSPYSWNLVIDMLGNYGKFDSMWEAINSMRVKGLVSLGTFASVFSNYVRFGNVKGAIAAFELMEEYGVVRDIVALNSLISAICREGKTIEGLEFLRVAKSRIKPDSDSYAMLLEGWEKEGNVSLAKVTFDEMVMEIGWDPSNVAAYDSFFNTLIKGKGGIHDVLKYIDILQKHRCYPGMKFFMEVLNNYQKAGDVRGAELIWEAMVGKARIRPDTEMYNLMILLYCHENHMDMAKKMLDEMVYSGAFPNPQSYNVLFHFLLKNRRLKDASSLFIEMIKNEFFPCKDDCDKAIKIFIDNRDPYMAIKIWKFMIENYDYALEDVGNLLVVSLHDAKMLPEAVKYAEGMMEKGIRVEPTTLSKLKESLIKARKEMVYEQLARKCKSF